MEKEIDLRTIWRIVRRRVWLIVLATVLSLVLAGGYLAFFAPRLYTSDVLLYIWRTEDQGTNDNSNISDFNFFAQLVNDYQVLIKSRLVTGQVAEILDMEPATASDLIDKISVATRVNTRHITITVQDTDPVRSAMIANTVSDVFSEVVVETMNAGAVKIIDRGLVPTSPSSPNVSLSLAIALILGLMIGVFLAFLIEMLDNKIRSAADLEELSDYKMLGFVPLVNEDAREGRR